MRGAILIVRSILQARCRYGLLFCSPSHYVEIFFC